MAKKKAAKKAPTKKKASSKKKKPSLADMMGPMMGPFSGANPLAASPILGQGQAQTRMSRQMLLKLYQQMMGMG